MAEVDRLRGVLARIEALVWYEPQDDDDLVEAVRVMACERDEARAEIHVAVERLLSQGVRAEVERLRRERDEDIVESTQKALSLVAAERDAARRDLGAILAVIHRDGGHHTGEHGLSQSVADAHATWAVVVRERDEARAQVKAWQAEELARRTERDTARAEVDRLRAEVERLRTALYGFTG